MSKPMKSLRKKSRRLQECLAEFMQHAEVRVSTGEPIDERLLEEVFLGLCSMADVVDAHNGNPISMRLEDDLVIELV